MKTHFLPITTIVADFIEDMGFEQKDLDDSLFTKWAIDATKLIHTDEQLCHQIALLDVKNYKAELPDDTKIMCEVAYRIPPKEEEGCGPKSERVIQYLQKTADDCELEINLKCPKCKKFECNGCGSGDVVVDVDRIWEMSNQHIHYSSKFMTVSHFGKGSSTHTPEFQLAKYVDHNWGGIQHLPKCMNLQCDNCTVEYSIKYPNIEVSFEEGELLVSYLGQVLDEEGNIMVPDHPSVIEAITDHITFKYFRKEYNNSKDMADYRAYVDARNSRDASIARARSAIQIPSPQAWMQKAYNSSLYGKMDLAYKDMIERTKKNTRHVGMRKSMTYNKHNRRFR